MRPFLFLKSAVSEKRHFCRKLRQKKEKVKKNS